MKKWIISIVVFVSAFNLLNAQFTNSELELKLINDSANKFGFPYLSLNKKGTAAAICPCWVYEKNEGYWKKTNDSTYQISLTDTAKEKYYRIAAIDSTPTKTFTYLYFKDDKGELIDLIHLKLHGENTIYHSNIEGKVLLLRPYNSLRYFIITEDQPKDTVYAVLQKFSPKMQYTITLTKPKRAHTFYFYLRKEKGLWAFYDTKNDKRIAWFTENMRDPYDKK